MYSVMDALTETEMDQVSNSKSCKAYARGSELFHEGQQPLGMHCVKQGHVKVTRTGHDGREQIIRFAGPGDVIGYAALVCALPYNTTARAVENSHVCFIPRERITRVVRENPRMALRMMQHISAELDSTERRVVELAQKSVRERLAEALLVLRETFGVMEDGVTLNMQLSRQEIADIVGTAPESAIRMLSELKDENIISSDGRKIMLNDMPALVRAANIND